MDRDEQSPANSLRREREKIAQDYTGQERSYKVIHETQQNKRLFSKL